MDYFNQGMQYMMSGTMPAVNSGWGGLSVDNQAIKNLNDTVNQLSTTLGAFGSTIAQVLSSFVGVNINPQQSPVMNTVVNALAMTKVGEAFGVPNPLVMQQTQQNLYNYSTGGFFANHHQAMQWTIARANAESSYREMSNDPTIAWKGGLNAGHTMQVHDWAFRNNLLNQNELVDKSGRYDSVTKAGMEGIGIGRNVLGMGNDGTNILNVIATVTGKGQNMEAAVADFKKQVYGALNAGMQIVEIQSSITKSLQQVAAMRGAGVDVGVAAQIMTPLNMSLDTYAKQQKLQGVDIDTNTVSNRIMQAATMKANDAESIDDIAFLRAAKTTMSKEEFDDFSKKWKGMSIDERKKFKNSTTDKDLLAQYKFNTETVQGMTSENAMKALNVSAEEKKLFSDTNMADITREAFNIATAQMRRQGWDKGADIAEVGLRIANGTASDADIEFWEKNKNFEVSKGLTVQEAVRTARSGLIADAMRGAGEARRNMDVNKEANAKRVEDMLANNAPLRNLDEDQAAMIRERAANEQFDEEAWKKAHPELDFKYDHTSADIYENMAKSKVGSEGPFKHLSEEQRSSMFRAAGAFITGKSDAWAETTINGQNLKFKAVADKDGNMKYYDADGKELDEATSSLLQSQLNVASDMVGALRLGEVYGSSIMDKNGHIKDFDDSTQANDTLKRIKATKKDFTKSNITDFGKDREALTKFIEDGGGDAKKILAELDSGHLKGSGVIPMRDKTGVTTGVMYNAETGEVSGINAAGMNRLKKDEESQGGPNIAEGVLNTLKSFISQVVGDGAVKVKDVTPKDTTPPVDSTGEAKGNN